MTDDATHWLQIAESPGDPGPLLVLADKVEERGELDLGYALRWAAAAQRFPMQFKAGGLATWFRERPRTRPACFDLPPVVFDSLRPKGQFGGAPSSRRHRSKNAPMAFRRLGEAIGGIRRAVQI